MKKNLFFAVAVVCCLQFLGSSSAWGQSHYWVMLTDKAGTTFDPYTYFDAKAIERYQLNGADLYDVSNYPLNSGYVSQIDALVSDDFGQSRWLNAVAVTATDEQIAAVSALPFVREVVMLGVGMEPASAESSIDEGIDDVYDSYSSGPESQILRMGGKAFRDAGINGRGVRIAVFDGGFPQVNTHIAFKHLRDEGRIVKTWNFPNKKEDVYGWNSHGLMTLTCIAGKHRYEGSDGEVQVDLGLATGAEFLLARTEVEAEPKKEEVWWQMAVEWADQNGAQIISSSLGYGKDRYYTRDMDGTSLVAKAGNMAARKGMLVCNSAGNEGSDNTWRTIITPSDADSVLCVGGITNSMTYYNHISFSSYGPSADGRQKPNVVAFGHAYTANTGKSNTKYHYVDGTSFSCPLVAGFAACALQARPGLTAMELFREIEKSADLYPYCDYTYGYGVPQASHFVGNGMKESSTGIKVAAKPTFRFVKDSVLKVVPLVESNERCYVFVKSADASGRISEYQQLELKNFGKDDYLVVTEGNIVTVHYKGYTESYAFGEASRSDHLIVDFVDDEKNVPSVDYNPQSWENYIDEDGSRWEFYAMLGTAVKSGSDEVSGSFWSPAKRIGVRRAHYFSKAYAWGFALEYGLQSHRLGDEIGDVDNRLYTDLLAATVFDDFTKHRVNIGEIGVELFQRVRLVPMGIFHKGWHWELGVYGNWAYNIYKAKGKLNGSLSDKIAIKLYDVEALSDYRWNWGVTTRVTRDWLGVYARYRLNGIGKAVAAGKALLPRLEVGLQLAF